ncbi:unnamed protein product [Penicillium nalgiovense]|nr:hypothetical protein HAV15_011171 [Penicillium sp. str. \
MSLDKEKHCSTSFSGPSDPNHTSPHSSEHFTLTGHASTISPQEEVLLIRFRDFCQENGYCRFPEDGQLNVDDTTLLRFLRANNLDLNKAVDRLRVVQDWRLNHAIEKSYLHMDVQCYEDYRKMVCLSLPFFSSNLFLFFCDVADGFASSLNGRRCDRQGLPLYVFPVKHFTAERMAAYRSKYNRATPTTVSQTQDLQCHILAFHALYENMLKFVMPLCSQLPHSHSQAPVCASTHIIDIAGVRLGHFWKIKKYLQGAISIATTHYPETLGHIFVVSAPPYFVKAWEIIKKWFDPASVSKILILSPSESKTILSAYIDLPNLPKEYGGMLSWEWGEMLNLEEPARDIASGIYFRDQNGDQQFLKGPVTFSGGSVHRWGTVDGELRRQTRKG